MNEVKIFRINPIIGCWWKYTIEAPIREEDKDHNNNEDKNEETTNS